MRKTELPVTLMKEVKSQNPLHSIFCSLKSNSVKLKTIGLKELAQYLVESSSTQSPLQGSLLSSLTSSIIGCMNAEFSKSSLNPRSVPRTMGKNRMTVSIALAIQFESVVKNLCCFRFYDLEPTLAIPLLAHVVFCMKHHVDMSPMDNSTNLWEASYQSCLAALLSVRSVVKVLPTHIIMDVARLLLQYPREKENKNHANLSLGVVKRIQLTLSLLSCDAKINRQNFIRAVCTKIASFLVECGSCTDHTLDNLSLSILCQSLHRIVTTYSLCFLATLYYCPKTWLALRILIQNWSKFNENSQAQLVEIHLCLLRCFQFPTYSHPRSFYNTTAGSLFHFGPLRLLFEPLKLALLKNVATKLTENGVDYDQCLEQHSFVYHVGDPQTHLVDSKLNWFTCSDINIRFEKQLDLLSEILLEMDLLCHQTSQIKSETASIPKPQIVERFLSLIYSSPLLKSYHELLPYILGVVLIQKLIQKRIDVSFDGLFTRDFINLVDYFKTEFLTLLADQCETHHPFFPSLHEKNINFFPKISFKIMDDSLICPKLYCCAYLLLNIFRWMLYVLEHHSKEVGLQSTQQASMVDHIQKKHGHPLLHNLLCRLLYHPASHCAAEKSDVTRPVYFLSSRPLHQKISPKYLVPFQRLLYILILFIPGDALKHYFETSDSLETLLSVPKGFFPLGNDLPHESKTLSFVFELTELNYKIWLLILHKLSINNFSLVNQLTQLLFVQAVKKDFSLQSLKYFSCFIHCLNTVYLNTDSHDYFSSHHKTPIQGWITSDSQAIGDLIRINSTMLTTISHASPPVNLNRFFHPPSFISQQLKRSVIKFLIEVYSALLEKKSSSLASMCVDNATQMEFVNEAILLVRSSLLGVIVLSENEFAQLAHQSSNLTTTHELNTYSLLKSIKIFFSMIMIVLIFSRRRMSTSLLNDVELFPHDPNSLMCHIRGDITTRHGDLLHLIQTTFSSSSSSFSSDEVSHNFMKDHLKLSHDNALDEVSFFKLFWEVSYCFQQLCFLNSWPAKCYLFQQLIQEPSIVVNFLYISLDLLQFLLIVTHLNSTTHSTLSNSYLLQDEFQENRSDPSIRSPQHKKVRRLDDVSFGFFTVKLKDSQELQLKHFHIPPLLRENPCHITQLLNTIFHVWLSSNMALDVVSRFLLKLFRELLSVAFQCHHDKVQDKIMLSLKQFETFLDVAFNTTVIESLKFSGDVTRLQVYICFLLDSLHLLWSTGIQLIEMYFNQPLCRFFQELFIGSLRMLCQFSLALKQNEQEYVWETLLLNKEEKSGKILFELLDIAHDRLCASIIGGFWLCAYTANQCLKHKDVLFRKFQSQVVPKVICGLQLYVTHLMSFKNFPCAEFSSIRFTLDLGGLGLSYVLQYVDQEIRNALLNLVSPSQFFEINEQCVCKKMEDIKQCLVPAQLCFEETVPPVGCLWELMWRSFHVLPFLQYISCFCLSTTANPTLEFLTLLLCCTASLGSTIPKKDISNQLQPFEILWDYHRTVFYYFQTVIYAIKDRVIPIEMKKVSSSVMLSEVSWMGEFLKLILDGIVTRSDLFESVECLEDPLSSLGLTSSSRYKFSPFFNCLCDEMMFGIQHYYTALLAAFMCRVNLTLKSYDLSSSVFHKCLSSENHVHLGIFLGHFLKCRFAGQKNSVDLPVWLQKQLQEDPSSLFNLIISIIQLFGSELLLFNLQDVLFDLLDVLKKSLPKIPNPLHPIFFIHVSLYVSSAQPKSIPHLLGFQIELIKRLPFDAAFVAIFQYVFSHVLHYFTNFLSCDLRKDILKQLVSLINKLPGSCLTRLLNPYNLSKQADTVLVFPCSLYFKLSHALVNILRYQEDTPPVHHQSCEDQRNFWLLYCMGKDFPQLQTMDDSLFSSIEPLLNVFEALIRRQLELQPQELDDQSKETKLSKTTLVHCLGYEFIFFFPPLQKLSENLLSQLLPYISDIIHKCILNESYSKNYCRQPFFNLRDVRHMLFVITQSHQHCLFGAAFQRRYICLLFSWLLFFYNVNSKTDQLMSQIVVMASNVWDDMKMLYSNIPYENMESYASASHKVDDGTFFKQDSSTHTLVCIPTNLENLKNFQLTLSYNLARQGLVSLAKGGVELRSSSRTSSWISSLQKCVSLPFFFQYLSTQSVYDPCENVIHATLYLQYTCFLLNMNSKTDLQDVHGMTHWINSLPCNPSDSLEMSPPWPSWVRSLTDKIFLFCNSENHPQSTQSCAVSPEIRIKMNLRETLPDYPNTFYSSVPLNPQGDYKIFLETNHLCNIFIHALQERNTLSLRPCKTSYLTETCILQLPLLVWSYCFIDTMRSETDSVCTKSCSETVNDLFHSNTLTPMTSYRNLSLRLLVSTICLTRELHSLLLEFHAGMNRPKTHGNQPTLLSVQHYDLMKKRSNADLGRIKTSLEFFLKNLNYKGLAHVSFYELGLTQEAHLFLHLDNLYTSASCDTSGHEELTFPKFSTSDSVLFLKSLSCLETQCEDGFHGNFEIWINPEIIMAEAEANRSHFRKLVLGNQLRQGSSLLIRTSPFSWWEASGLLTSFPWNSLHPQMSATSRYDLRMEWLWRLGQWNTCDEMLGCPSSFHGILLYSFRSLDQYVRESYGRLVPDITKNGSDRSRQNPSICLQESLNISFSSVVGTMDLHDQTQSRMGFFASILQQCLWISLHSVLTHLSPQRLPVLIQEWVDVLTDLNNSPGYFWFFEPVLAYQKQIIHFFNSYYHNSFWNDFTEEFQIASLHFRDQYYRTLRSQGFQESALAISVKEASHHVTATSLVSFPDCLAEWLLIENVHATENAQRSLVLARPLVERFQKATVLDLTRQEAQFASVLLSTVGTWMFEAQWEDFDAIEKNYMQPAIVFTQHYPTLNTLKSHQSYATLLDQIIQTYEKNLFSQHTAFQTTQHQSHKQSLDVILEEIKSLQRQGELPHSHLLCDKARLETIVTKEREILGQQKENIYQFCSRAVHHYLSWLCHVSFVSDDTLKSTCRCLSLWFKYSNLSTATTLVFKKFLSSNEQALSILHHFQPFIYQIASRLNSVNSLKEACLYTKEFQTILVLLLEKLILQYPFHTLFPLLLLENGENVPVDYKRRHPFGLQKNQIQAVKNVFTSLLNKETYHDYGLILQCHKIFTSFLINLGHLKTKSVPSKLNELPNYKEFIASSICLPVPTTLPHFNVPLFLGLTTQSQPFLKNDPRTTMQQISWLQSIIQKKLRFRLIQKIIPSIKIIETGLSQPKVLSFLDTSGYLHSIIVKGRDDLRTDAVTEQMFVILNCIFASVKEAQERHLVLRTYRVIPLSPVVGLVQWVTGTITLGEFLVGNSSKPFSGMHMRYYPNDMLSTEARRLLDETRKNSSDQLHSVYQQICQAIHPVMRLSFLDIFPEPSAWFASLQQYTRSLALGSMIGYLIGLGDRHTNNLLLDLHTGSVKRLSTQLVHISFCVDYGAAELIHIDFGVLFDRAKTLSIPETVPFRLTRDLVAALGPIALEGVFRAICEVTLNVLRQMNHVIISLLEVFLFDPLYIWATNTSVSLAEDKCSHTENTEAQAALVQLEKKNLGLLCSVTSCESEYTQLHPIPVPSLVDRLFRQSTSAKNLCRMFSGWAPWL